MLYFIRNNALFAQNIVRIDRDGDIDKCEIMNSRRDSAEKLTENKNC